MATNKDVSLDDIRPSKTVEVECSVPGCGWSFWVDALDPSLPDGPFLCAEHDPNFSGEKAKDVP